MAQYFVDIPWTSQPPPGTPIDWSHPLARGLTIALRPINGFHLINDARPQDVVVVNRAAGDAFLGDKWLFTNENDAGNQTYFQNEEDFGTDKKPRSLCAKYALDAYSGDRDELFVVGRHESEGGQASVQVRQDAGGTTSVKWQTGNYYQVTYSENLGLSAGDELVVSGSVDPNRTSAEAEPYVRFNGVQNTPTGNSLPWTSGNYWYSARNYYVGRLYSWSNYYGIEGFVFYAFAWDRYISPAEMEAFEANPWQIYEPQRIPIYPPAGAGGGTPTQFLQSVGGAIAPLGGAIKDVAKLLAGAFTPSGTQNRSVSKSFAGSITPTGTQNRETSKSFAGSITPSGTISPTLTFLRTVVGSITPSGGVTKAITKLVAGVITPAASIVKRAGKSVAGSITPTGAQTRSTSKTVTGSTTPSGIISTTLVFLRTITGSLPSSGAVTKQTSKNVAGEIDPAGSATKQTGKQVAGTLSSSGDITRETDKQVDGSIAPDGGVSTGITLQQAVSGALSVITGALNAVKLLPPTIASAGARAIRLMGNMFNRRQ